MIFSPASSDLSVLSPVVSAQLASRPKRGQNNQRAGAVGKPGEVPDRGVHHIMALAFPAERSSNTVVLSTIGCTAAVKNERDIEIRANDIEQRRIVLGVTITP